MRGRNLVDKGFGRFPLCPDDLAVGQVLSSAEVAYILDRLAEDDFDVDWLSCYAVDGAEAADGTLSCGVIHQADNYAVALSPINEFCQGSGFSTREDLCTRVQAAFCQQVRQQISPSLSVLADSKVQIVISDRCKVEIDSSSATGAFFDQDLGRADTGGRFAAARLRNPESIFGKNRPLIGQFPSINSAWRLRR